GYYLDVDYQWGTSWFQGLIPYNDLRSSEELSPVLKRFGITHVVVDRSRVSSESEGARRLMAELLERRGKRLLEDGKYALYQVELEPRPLGPAQVSRLSPNPTDPLSR
ncbi:MAG: hypothetical protein Q7J64_00425, partial [Elusimicrobiota bacterium]|nr:hypothetical protein [Elusimicrobiota bacterium]